MKVAELLEARRGNWRELEALAEKLSQRRSKLRPDEATRFASLYRAACADLALADAYQLPPNTVQYLHQLVGRAHNQLYRSRAFLISAWGRELLVETPRRVLFDRCFWLASLLFWGVFFATMFLGFVSPEFSERVVGKEMLRGMEQMYSKPVSGRNPNESGAMAGFYVQHNAGIGLQCFAAGLLLGVGGIFITVSNAAILGTVFGFMLTTIYRENFYTFVTAHGPFELTAIVLASAAGMRMGFSLIDTRGRTRSAALVLAAREALPMMCASIVLFCLAACIEGFISPSSLPYPIKAAVAALSTLLMVAYFGGLGLRAELLHATR